MTCAVGWKLAIAGRADHETKFSKDLMMKASGNKDIVFTGFVSGSDLRELYSHAGIFVLPS